MRYRRRIANIRSLFTALKMDIRLLHPSDIPQVQQTNITNLPENYFCKYYMYHALSWPQLSYVAVDVSVSRMTARIYTHLYDTGLTTEEDTIRRAQNRRICAGEDGGRSGRWNTARSYHITQCHENTPETGTGGEAYAPKP